MPALTATWPQRFTVILVLVVITSCAARDQDGCEIHQIVDKNKYGFVEIDDGHTYYIPGYYNSYFETGDHTSVCDVVSKIDGSHHYSLRVNGSRLVAATRDSTPPPNYSVVATPKPTILPHGLVPKDDLPSGLVSKRLATPQLNDGPPPPGVHPVIATPQLIHGPSPPRGHFVP